MNKQEEIREGIERILDELLFSPSESGNGYAYNLGGCIDNLISYLHSQGVVIKVDRELPDNEVWHKVEREFEAYCAGRNDMLKAGYVAVEPLIKEEK